MPRPCPAPAPRGRDTPGGCAGQRDTWCFGAPLPPASPGRAPAPAGSLPGPCAGTALIAAGPSCRRGVWAAPNYRLSCPDKSGQSGGAHPRPSPAIFGGEPWPRRPSRPAGNSFGKQALPNRIPPLSSRPPPRHPDHLRPQVPAGPPQLPHGQDPALSPPQYSRCHQPRRGRRGAQSGHQQLEPPGEQAIHG